MFRVAIAILQITASNLLSLDMEGMIKVGCKFLLYSNVML